MNDVNILNGSTNSPKKEMIPIFYDNVSGKQYDRLDYLVDEKYSQQAIFIHTIARAGTRKERCFSEQ